MRHASRIRQIAMSKTEQYWEEFRKLELKLCCLMAHANQYGSETAKLRRQKKRIIDTAIGNCASDRTFWLRIKALSCSRHSQRVELLAQSFEMAKRKRNLPEQFHAASALAEEYSERSGKQALVSKWLRHAAFASASQPKRVMHDLLNKLKLISKSNQQNVEGRPTSPRPNGGLPSPETAPALLRNLDGNCGPITAWVILKHFGITVSATHLIKSCGYTRGYGVPAIGLAVALKEHGMEVLFHTEHDPNPTSAEKEFVIKARNLGIPMRDAVSLRVLLRHASCGNVPIVLYDTPNGEGHFSPLVGVQDETLILPHERGGSMSRHEFLKRWRSPGILRQSIIVLLPRKNA